MRYPVCCILRHSHVATLLQNETISYCEFAEREFSNCDIFSLWDLSHFDTLFHNENVHNATTSHYGICCTMRQRLNMRIVVHCENAIIEPCGLVLFLNTLCSKCILSNRCKPLKTLRKVAFISDLN